MFQEYTQEYTHQVNKMVKIIKILQLIYRIIMIDDFSLNKHLLNIM